MPIDLKSTSLGKNGFEQPRVVLAPGMEVVPPTGFSWPFDVTQQPMVVTAAAVDEEEGWEAALQISPNNGATWTDVVIHTKPVILSATNTLLTVPIAGKYRLRTDTENTTYVVYTLTMTHDPVLPMVDLQIQGAQGNTGPTGPAGSGGEFQSQKTDITGQELLDWWNDGDPQSKIFVDDPGALLTVYPLYRSAQWLQQNTIYTSGGVAVGFYYDPDPAFSIDTIVLNVIDFGSLLSNTFFADVVQPPSQTTSKAILGNINGPIFTTGGTGPIELIWLTNGAAGAPFTPPGTGSIGGDGGSGYFGMVGKTFIVADGNGDAIGVIDSIDGGTGAILTFHLINPGTGYPDGNDVDTEAGGPDPYTVGAGAVVDFTPLPSAPDGILRVTIFYTLVEMLPET